MTTEGDNLPIEATSDLGDRLGGEWEAWLATRHPIIRELANLYPPGTCLDLDGEIVHVIAYTEDGGLEVTKTDPSEDYEKAVDDRFRICAECLSTHTGGVRVDRLVRRVRKADLLRLKAMMNDLRNTEKNIRSRCGEPVKGTIRYRHIKDADALERVLAWHGYA